VEQASRAAETESDRTSRRRRLATCSCRFRSIATGRGEIPGRRQRSSAPPAAAPESGRRVDRQSSRCARDVLHGQKYRVVGAGDVTLGPALQTLVLVEKRGSRRIRFSAQCCSEEFLGRVLRGPLQGRVGFIGRNALQVWFAPGRFQRLLGSRWRLSLRRWDGYRVDGARRGDRNRRHRS
jgi:hypothetical protein